MLSFTILLGTFCVDLICAFFHRFMLKQNFEKHDN